MAGVSVDQIKKGGADGASKEETKENPPELSQSASSASEFSAMKQEEQMKAKILQGVTRIYEQHEVNPLLAQQIVTFLPRYE